MEALEGVRTEQSQIATETLRVEQPGRQIIQLEKHDSLTNTTQGFTSETETLTSQLESSLDDYFVREEFRQWMQLI